MSKKEADAYDRMLDAASELADLIEESGIAVSEFELEELSIFLAQHSKELLAMLKPVRMSWADLRKKTPPDDQERIKAPH